MAKFPLYVRPSTELGVFCKTDNMIVAISKNGRQI